MKKNHIVRNMQYRFQLLFLLTSEYKAFSWFGIRACLSFLKKEQDRRQARAKRSFIRDDLHGLQLS